jgi:Uma2 family endonuclease
MVQVGSNRLTIAEFLDLPEVKPAAEYIDGQIIQKPMPQGKHSRIQGAFVPAINTVVQPRKIAYAFPELRCTYPAGSRNSVYGGRSTVPDVAVFVWSRIPQDDDGEIANVFSVAPDWTIEILSPDQSHTKVTKNILHCLKHGAQVGWLIDPEEKTVFVYRPKQEIEVFEELDVVLPMPDFMDGFRLTVQDLFAWLVL